MNTTIGNHTFQLFTYPSFLEGVGQLVDVTGSLNRYKTTDTDPEADTKALKSDWEAVGSDLRTAIKEYGEQEELGQR